MIVVDASAMVEALIGRDVDESLLDVLAGDLAAPHLLDIEVLSVLRGLTLSQKLPLAQADTACAHHFALMIDRHDIAPLAGRIWELRHQYTTYDAAYLALAEILDVPIHTCDAKLDSGGHTATVRIHPQTH